MATTDALYVGTGANYNDGGTTAWTNPTNIQGDTTSTAATCAPGSTNGNTSQRLRATNFGFNIPSTATIDGITVKVEQVSGTNNRNRWHTVQLLKAGAETGNNLSDSSAINSSKTIKTFGSSSNLWGATLSASDVNNTGFGVSFKIERYGGATTTSLFRATITVEYTESTAPTVTTQDCTDVTATSAIGNGNITATGGVAPTRRGFCYIAGTSGTPTISDSVVYDDGAYDTGAYTKGLSSLTSGGKYRVRAYATNSAGTGYGSTVQLNLTNETERDTTQSATARIQKSFEKTQDAISRVAKSIEKTQDAAARISKEITKTQTSESRIQKDFNKTQESISRITKELSKEQDATANIVVLTENYKEQPATARLSKSSEKTQSANANIVTLEEREKTQQGTARVSKDGTKTQDAISRVQKTYEKTQNAQSRVQKSLTSDQSATSRIIKSLTKDQPATASIVSLDENYDSIIGTARITATQTKTQGATANIVVLEERNKTQEAKARVSKEFTKTQQGTAYIVVESEDSLEQPAIARIQKSVAKTQPAEARIAKEFTKEQTAIFKIQIIGTKDQLAVSRISATLTSEQPATALITDEGEVVKTKTQTAGAYIFKPYSDDIILVDGKLALKIAEGYYIKL